MKLRIKSFDRKWSGETIESLRDLIDSGVSYWASDDGTEEHELPLLFVLTETEDSPPKTFRIDLAMLALGINRIMSGAVPINSASLGNIARFVINNDVSRIDSEDADLIVQAACFNEIKYG